MSKPKLRAIIIFITLLGVSLSSLFITGKIIAAPPAQSDTPVHGWNVCEDLGMGAIPGLGDTRQRFRLCNSGWEILTYCLDPGEAPPTVGAMCSRVSEDVYWCSDAAQQIRFYEMVQTPAPEQPPAPTHTPTPTVTSTPTPTNTTQPPSPPQESEEEEEEEAAPTAQPAPRPQPGGPGNLGYLLAAGFTVLGGGGFTFYRLAIKRK